MDDMIYGKLDERGAIEEEVENCAVSGKPVLDQHATFEQIGSRHFVRILATKTHLVTDEMRAKWYTDCGETVATEQASAPVEQDAKSSTRRRSNPASAESTEEN